MVYTRERDRVRFPLFLCSGRRLNFDISFQITSYYGRAWGVWNLSIRRQCITLTE